MSNDKFEIFSDPRRALLHIILRGHWDIETVELYKAAVAKATADMYAAGCEPGSLIALVDARAGGAQSQDVIAYYQQHLGPGSGLSPRRLATLVSSALFKRQIERIAIPNQRLFTDEGAAWEWLLSGEGQ